jgi:stress-induced-phosphoprotein 1
MSAAAFKDQGNKFLQAKQYDEAIRAYTEAINLDPNDHIFFSNRSAAYLSKGDAASALSDGERCIKLSPQWAKGYSRKGAALHALKRYDDAIAVYQDGLAIAPSDEGLKNALQEVQKAKESTNANAGGASGNPLGGLFGPQMLTKLAGHPKFGPKLGDPAFRMKLQLFQQNPQMMMQDPEMMEVLTAILGLGAGDNDSADNMPPPRSTTTDSTPATSSSSGAKKAEPVPEPEEDLTEEEREVKRLRSESNSLKDQGNTFYKNKQFAEALAAYDEAYAKDNTNLMVLNNKAAVYIETAEVDSALQTCQEILDKASSVKLSFDDRAKVYQRMAAAHLKRNDYPAAIASYNKAQMEKYDKTIERKI